MKGKIKNLSILIISIMILSISASTLKKSKLQQSDETIHLTPTRPLSSDPGATIDVVGQAIRTVETDYIKINLQIVTLSWTTKESMKRNNKISKELESIITSLNIDLKNITTTDFSLYPQYEWENITQIFKGYQTVNSLELTLSNLKLAGEVLDATSKLENLQIHSVYSGVSSQKVEETKNSMIDEAVADAQRIAGITLRTMNSEVKSVETISINKYGSSINLITPKAYGRMQSEAQIQSAPTLYKNKQEITLSVVIRFKIGAAIQ